jgi:hypothetical protein
MYGYSPLEAIDLSMTTNYDLILAMAINDHNQHAINALTKLEIEPILDYLCTIGVKGFITPTTPSLTETSKGTCAPMILYLCSHVYVKIGNVLQK